jgi:hypothetical protein
MQCSSAIRSRRAAPPSSRTTFSRTGGDRNRAAKFGGCSNLQRGNGGRNGRTHNRKP